MVSVGTSSGSNAMNDDGRRSHSVLPLLAGLTQLSALAFGDHQQQLGDERTLLYQNRLRHEVTDLENIALLGTYHVRRS